MIHSKKTLQGHLMTLKSFADVFNKRLVTGRRLIYEVNCLVRDSSGNLFKKIYFVLGHSILPDDAGVVESCWIHLLTTSEIESYLDSCQKYNILCE